MNYINNDFKKRFFLVVTGVVGLGIFLSFLIEVNYGTDTSTFMNMALSNRFGLTFGTCMMLANLIFFIPQIFFGRKLINIGTFMNMFLIGYISDFCRYLWKLYLPIEIFTLNPYRPIVFVLALIPFLISAALYMNANFGLVPYDAIPALITKKLGIPYFYVRIVWDFTIIFIGLLAGKSLTIGTIALAILIGPTVSFIGNILNRYPKHSNT